ncbi:hypothetical protein NPA08_00585 [Mycoplasmopsis citelli]|uniref:hypothetical protein n=1 Tax=Mycoplasmopsis citelli TaxID=171281 RepID=UPI002114AE9F|nr:hypothetical protein [Mycoplasmopsis citelli]UUD36322.1 hypothetical protein NPA08_00585 [Mycoplasmopsis citelli]
MKKYLKEIGVKEDTLNSTKLEIAKNLELIDDGKHGYYRVKNFAVLMFCEYPKKFIPNAYVEITREVNGTDKIESKIFDGPIWTQAQQVSQYFEENVFSSYIIRTNNKTEHNKIYNYPLNAFRELANNAILHNEYDNNENIRITFHKKYIFLLLIITNHYHQLQLNRWIKKKLLIRENI